MTDTVDASSGMRFYTTGTYGYSTVTSSLTEVSALTMKDNAIYCACWVHERKLMPTDINGKCVKCGGNHTAQRAINDRLYGRAPMGAIVAAGLDYNRNYRVGVSDDGEKSAVCYVTVAPLTLEEQVDPLDDLEEDEDVDDPDIDDDWDYDSDDDEDEEEDEDE